MGQSVGRQLLLALFESEDDRYAWLNNAVCVAEGAIDAVTFVSHFEIHVCHSDLVT